VKLSRLQGTLLALAAVLAVALAATFRLILHRGIHLCIE